MVAELARCIVSPFSLEENSMHPLGTPPGTPSLGAPAHLTSRLGDFSSQISTWDEVSIKAPIHVLSVGRIEPGTLIRDAHLDSPIFRVSFVHDYRELWISSKQYAVHAVVMHNSLCSFELAEAARLVRNRWPKAKILMIRSGEVTLEPPLYDHRLVPPVNPKLLISMLLNLANTSNEGDIRNDDR